MSKKKLTYNERRALLREQEQQARITPVENTVTNAYLKAQRYLTEQVNKLVQRLQNKTEFEENEIKKILNETVQPADLIDLKHLAKNISDPELQLDAQKKLNILAAKGRITRLEDLKAKSYLVSKQVADVQLKQSTNFYIDEIQDSYKDAVAESYIERMRAKGINFQTWNKSSEKTRHEFKELSTPAVKNILESHWHGANYSKRIWNDTDALAKRLEELFTVEALTGMSEFDMAKMIAKEFHQSIGVARRLIRTESNYMANQAKLKAWIDNGVKQYRLVAVLDLRTSVICQGKDGEVHNVTEAVVNGKYGNYPPFHPFVERLLLLIMELVLSIATEKQTTPSAERW